MASWSEIEAEVPDLAQRARRFLEGHTHLTLATLRRDGSPRISGSEIQLGDGELWFGSMWKAMKALDLRRDPRLALHSASVDPPDDPTGWAGDAKLAGRAVEVDDPALLERLGPGEQADADPADRAHLFRVDITELVHTRVGDPADHLVIDLWQEGKGLRRMRRR